jgi:hypothetical protein
MQFYSVLFFFLNCTKLKRNTALFPLRDSSLSLSLSLSLLVSAFIPSTATICKKRFFLLGSVSLRKHYRLPGTSYSVRAKRCEQDGVTEQRSETLDTSWYHSKNFYGASYFDTKTMQIRVVRLL